MNHKINVSVIVPTRNRKKLLEKTIECFRNQTVSNEEYEIVVIDDGSKDGTGKMLEQFKDLPIKYFYLTPTPFSCCPRARNFGIEKSIGELLIFIDGDQLLPSDFIEQHLRFHQVYDRFMLLGYRDDIDEKGTIPDERNNITRLLSQNWANLKTAWHLGFGCNMSVYRKWAVELGGFDEKMLTWGLEDIEFVYRVYKLGVKIVLNKHVTTKHFPHERLPPEERYFSWKKNLDYFICKHNNREARAQKLLIPSSHHESHQNYDWAESFVRMEEYATNHKINFSFINIHIINAENLIQDTSFINELINNKKDRENHILDLLMIEDIKDIDMKNW
ncbi:glycosyltransferase, partial [Bacillus velezensis]|uniref:glycosyltransferase n=1 Tax=Bacillus velezensis TaxID=492670 RepID=UPI003396B0A6